MASFPNQSGHLAGAGLTQAENPNNDAKPYERRASSVPAVAANDRIAALVVTESDVLDIAPQSCSRPEARRNLRTQP